MFEILTAASDGFLALLTAEVFLYLMIGILIGMFFGLVPGLSGLTGMGLLMPFAFGQPPEVALAFLLGMFAVTTQTDTIPAVLIGVPGTAAAQATVIDGYPMAKNGEAGRALSASYFGSIFGTMVSAVIFILFLPVLRGIIDGFAGPEYFILAMFGLLMAGSLSGTSVLRGVMMAGLGLIIAMIGYAPNTGFPRFDFGWVYLLDGIPIVPIVLGLFAVPEVIDLLLRRGSISRSAEPKGGIYDGFADTVREWWLVIRCGTIGTICGMIPGLGGLVAEWLGYGHAVSTAKDNSRFGKGDVRGVIAPETTTAGQKPSALLPTVAFGIPGNAPMAIMLGVFLIVGLRPGPEMLTSKLDLTFLMVWTVVLGNIIAAILCLGLQKYLIAICFIRGSVLAPVILCFMAVGATLATKDFGDIFIFGVFGALGYLFKRADWPRVPLIIGMVLGHLAEAFLFISVDRYGVAWMWERPIVLIVEICMLLVVGIPLYRRFVGQQNRTRRAVERAASIIAAFRSPTWWIGIGFISVALYIMAASAEWSLGGKLFPWIVGSIVLLCGVLHSMYGVVRGVEASIEAEGEPGVSIEWRHKLTVFAWILGFLFALPILGYAVTLPMFIIVFMISEGEKWWVALLVALGVWLFVFVVLVETIHVNLPRSGLEELLKW